MMSSPISEAKVSDVLADEVKAPVQAGTLSHDVHLSGEWLSALVDFIAETLPDWRDDRSRPAQTSETRLTTQLCARLNSVSRHSGGWDFLQFRREEPDEVQAGRSIDLVAAPSGAVIWMDGREYSEYRALLPIECKRLPTPSRKDRDEREYVFSRFRSAGGIQRFKAGHHGAAYARAAMIGYVQDRDIPFWFMKVEAWIDGLVAATVQGWSVNDKLRLAAHLTANRVASLQSKHQRECGLDPIRIDHLWIEM
ncbi:MAG: hypothetical protein OXG99_04575 [Alphaproteobacteria bacterium]|nr:hypothetical protein [Alphaproteobacteria bacterium]